MWFEALTSFTMIRPQPSFQPNGIEPEFFSSAVNTNLREETTVII